LIRRLRPLIARGLAAAVYTQTTDVEGEVNGLMTYDRQIIKYDVERLATLHRELYLPQQPLHFTEVVPTGEAEPKLWRYTTKTPDENWTRTGFNDADWQEGPSGFGERSTPGTTVRTAWKTEDIWLRRTIDLDPEALDQLYLRIHHDEDAEVYLNGELIASLSGYQVEYIDMELDESAKQLVRKGANVIAVHCHQTGGGQYIDVGLLNGKK
jgi:hypothetical protein